MQLKYKEFVLYYILNTNMNTYYFMNPQREVNLSEVTAFMISFTEKSARLNSFIITSYIKTQMMSIFKLNLLTETNANLINFISL